MASRRRRHRNASLERLLLPTAAIVVAAVLATLLVRGTASSAAGWLAAAAGVIGVALVVTTRSGAQLTPGAGATMQRVGDWLLVPLPALALLYLAFNSGGYFPGAKNFLAFLLALALALRFALARSPLAGYTLQGAIAAGTLTLFSLWVLLSGIWSHAWGRSFLECGQALVYALTVALFASAPRSGDRIRWMLRGVTLAAVVVCGCGFVTRVAPDVWAGNEGLAPERLSFPLGYWNALGILAALALVLGLHLATSTRERPWIAILAAAAMPLTGATLLFTFSRGAIAAVAIGIVAYLVVGRPRGALGGLVATVPATAVAVASAYGADLLARSNPTIPAAVTQGHGVARTVVACMVAAAVLRALLIPLDRRVARFRLPVHLRRPAARAGWAAFALACVVVVAALVGSGTLRHQYDRFVHTDTVKQTADVRARLTDPGNNHRIDQWRVGMHQFSSRPLSGHGGGTYQLMWDARRPDASTVTDAHSLYVETLAELGIVGAVLLVVALVLLLWGPLRRARGRNRSLYAAIFAAGLAWVVHAGVDWDWEMPAVSLPFFALGAAALARSARRSERAAPPVAFRAGLTAIALAAAIVPMLVTISESHLSDAQSAIRAPRCAGGVADAQAASSALGVRAEPYQALAYCRLEQGRERAAVTAIQKAVKRDPGFWRYRYDEALISAAAGLNPLPATRAALARDPREPQILLALNGFKYTPRSKWRHGALREIAAER